MTLSSDFTQPFAVTNPAAPPPPLIGALLRIPFETVRDRMLTGLHERGYTDLIAAHLNAPQALVEAGPGACTGGVGEPVHGEQASEGVGEGRGGLTRDGKTGTVSARPSSARLSTARLRGRGGRPSSRFAFARDASLRIAG